MILDKKQTAEMNNQNLEKNKAKREAVSNYLGSSGIKKSFYNQNTNQSDFFKGDKITNNSSKTLKEAISNNIKASRSFARKRGGGYVINGNQVSYI